MNRSTAIRGIWLISSAMMVAAATIAGTPTAGAAPQPAGPTAKPFTLAPSMGMDKLDPQAIARSNRQQLLDKIAGQITDGLSESARAKIPGFTEIVVSPDKNHIRLYWKGAPPQRVRDILAHLPAGVTADVVSARYSKAELHAARNKLLRGGKPMGLHVASTATPLRITSIAPAVDGSGLEIGYDEDRGVQKRDLVDPLSSQARKDRSSKVKAATDHLTGINTKISYQPLSKDLSRQSDSSPWYGGSAIKSPTTAICTTGFPVTNGSSYMLTVADHCVGDQPWSTWGAGTQIGQSFPVPNTSIPDDTDLLYPTSHAVGGYLFDGLPDLSSIYAKPLIGWQHNNVGDYVCTDGANSGVHCNVQIQQTDIGVTGSNGNYRPITDLATQITPWTQDIAAQDGDSGGPVFAGANNWTADEARGTITANKYQIDCPSTEQQHSLVKTAYCYGGTYYVPIYQILSDDKLTLVTGS
ncbi:hypothetical protein [Streptomyces sp. TP-A0356]|uniref:hypothetical protein n=1 Tax=Streptomyces sp. TP-A0356 TaxID=1359208 RepID=UPI000AC675DE|nr:hypothetical protein [Streptomyces sp. TP-A0356]